VVKKGKGQKAKGKGPCAARQAASYKLQAIHLSAAIQGCKLQAVSCKQYTSARQYRLKAEGSKLKANTFPVFAFAFNLSAFTRFHYFDIGHSTRLRQGSVGQAFDIQHSGFLPPS
jgi:hypothetical protein